MQETQRETIIHRSTQYSMNCTLNNAMTYKVLRFEVVDQDECYPVFKLCRCTPCKAPKENM